MSRPEPPSPSLATVWATVDELWPRTLAEPWDAVGPVTGDPDQPVKCIVFAVDPTLAVVDDALERGADLLITHHPLLLRGVNSVAADTFKGRVVHRLIENGCGLLTAHTNGDCAIGGVSEVLIRSCGVQDSEPLVPSAGGVDGEGLGRVGDLPRAVTLNDFAGRVYSVLPSVAGGVRVAGDPNALVRRVAVCGGAGDSLFDEVRDSGADVYVTADLRHHPASEAREAAAGGRPYLVDVSHFASEWLWLGAAAGVLHRSLQDQGFDVEIAVSGVNTDPWDFILTP
jgi:dinuclear metal center YbgI/SA1388 family protein